MTEAKPAMSALRQRVVSRRLYPSNSRREEHPMSLIVAANPIQPGTIASNTINPADAPNMESFRSEMDRVAAKAQAPTSANGDPKAAGELPNDIIDAVTKYGPKAAWGALQGWNWAQQQFAVPGREKLSQDEIKVAAQAAVTNEEPGEREAEIIGFIVGANIVNNTKGR